MREATQGGRRQYGLGQGSFEGRLDTVELSEPDRELEVAEPELPRGCRIEIGAGLEVVRRHAELRSETAQRFHRRLPRARFDA